MKTKKDKKINLTYICKIYNKKYDTVHRRIIRGWTLEEALELVIDNSGEIVLHGRTFESLRDAAKAYRLSIIYIIKELRNNKSVLEIFRIKNNKALIVNGKKQESIEKALENINISKRLYMQKIRKGWFIEEIIEGKRDTGNRSRYYKGKYFKNLKEISEYYNLDYNNFTTRLRRGWTLEEAINQKRNKKKRR